MLKYMAIGDAYGAAYEFVDASYAGLIPGFSLYPNDLKYRTHPLVGHSPHFFNPAGSYTDDTQRSISVARVLEVTDTPTTLDFADSLIREYISDRARSGYAKGFKGVLDKSRSGQALINALIPTSSRNGAAMSSGIIGIMAKNVEMALRNSRTNAELTHNSPNGILSAQIVAISALYLRDNDNIAGLAGELKAILDYNAPQSIPTKPTDLDGMQTVHNVIGLLLHGSRKLSDLLKSCIALGGDTDTCAAITMCLASANLALWEDDLPLNLFNDLEKDNAYGREAVQKLYIPKWLSDTV